MNVRLWGYGLAGFGLGLLALLGVLSVWLWAQGGGLDAAADLTPTQLAPTPKPRASRTPRPTASPAEQALAQAEAALDSDPQTTIDLLTPLLNQLAEPAHLARAYRALALAYSQLGRYQFAASYFKRLYDLEPTAENLWQLARAYDLGGDLAQALARYQELAAWPAASGEFYQTLAQERIEHLMDVLGTATPTPITDAQG